MTPQVIDLLNDGQTAAEGLLCDLLAIPSISTDSSYSADVQRCCDWIVAFLHHSGFPAVEKIHTAGHPIVYAEDLGAGPTMPTVLLYGHYDVQPVDPIGLWTNPPFTPTIRDGKIYARGATDDKGQVLLHLLALQALRSVDGRLPVNVKLIIEGEEEIGSPNLATFVASEAAKLACDCVLVSDTSMFGPGQPSIVYGLRGLAYMQIDVTGPNRDLHSGSYGGAVANPLNALASILASLKSDEGIIQIPGFYDDVTSLDVEERSMLAELGYTDERMMTDVGVSALAGERGFTTIERLGTRPTLDVNGMLGGYTGEGAKTVLPSTAMAKVSMRLVPHQTTDDIARKFTEHVKRVTPPGVQVTIHNLHGADPVVTRRDTPAVTAAVRALEETYNRTCLFTREGGSIPVVLLFDTLLNAPTVLMGFGLNNENAHSPDEHFDLNNFHLGAQASARFYSYLAELPQ